MKEITTIQGAWSDDANGWLSEDLEITGDCYLEVELPQKGRLVIKKSENHTGPWPKALVTKWSGPSFRIRILHGRDEVSANTNGTGHNRYLRIVTTVTPTRIQLANI